MPIYGVTGSSITDCIQLKEINRWRKSIVISTNYPANQVNVLLRVTASIFIIIVKLFADFQTWIGYEDVKSHPVYFYVQKNTDFLTHNTPIPFDIELLNVGNAMNVSSGIFTAPRSGRYFFTFTGIKDEAAKGTEISLRLNGGHITQTYSSYGGSYYTYSLQTTLNLQGGDKVSLVLINGALHDNSITRHSTLFFGWLLEEDIFKN